MSDLKSTILSEMSISRFYEYFGNHLSDMTRMNTSGWVTAKCPFHEEKNPSFGVNFLKEGAFKCQACEKTGDLFTFHQLTNNCNFKEAIRYFAGFVGIDPDANPEYSKETKKQKKKEYGEVDQIYQYIDLDGKIISETVKYKDPKDFRQRRPDPDNPRRYKWNLKDVEVIPYNLQKMWVSDIVYFTEGEKDCDTLADQGLVATCNPMGAGKWWDSLTPWFQDKHVIILPDNDEPGRAHAEKVAFNLKNTAKSVSIVNLPGLPPGGDVSDWLAAGHTKQELEEIVKKKATPYQSHIDFLNKHHACIDINGKFTILNEKYDAIFQRQMITFSSEYDLKLKYANRQVPNPRAGEKGQPQTINIVTDWLRSSDRREYDQIVFNPKGTPNCCYNYWQGFAISPQPGDWSLMQAHILDHICGGNKQYYNWLVCWMARIVQDPGGKRPGTAIVLRGDQGTGKGVFLSEFGSLFGSHYLQITNQQHLTGRFNAHVKDIVYLFVDEGFWASDRAAEGTIRAIVSEDLLIIEAKGRDPIFLKNYINLAIASNNEWVIPSGLDERRFACFQVQTPADKKQNSAYFQTIIDQMASGGREAMMHDLLHKEIDVDLRRIPRTDALFDQIIATMNPVQRFWLEILRRGTLHPEEIDWTCEIRKNMLHNQYLEWCDTYNIKMKYTPIQFGKRINKLFPPSTESHYGTIGGPDIDGKYTRKWKYIFPDLLICREFFQKTVRMGVDFDTDEGFDIELDTI
jgi:hypothetical protein